MRGWFKFSKCWHWWFYETPEGSDQLLLLKKDKQKSVCHINLFQKNNLGYRNGEKNETVLCLQMGAPSKGKI